MAKYNRYDISGSGYTQSMEEKTTRYNNLVRQAERINYNNDGKASKEEAEFYYQAVKVCEEIMNLNLSQRAVYAQWQLRRQNCESAVKRICDAIAPPPPAPRPAPQPADIPQSVKSGTAANSRDGQAPASRRKTRSRTFPPRPSRAGIRKNRATALTTSPGWTS